MTDPARLCIVTSVAPHRVVAQQRAVASWKRLGAEVLSLNAADELRLLAPQFPEVQFLQAARDAQTFLGRPCVFIRDLMQAAAGSGATVCGVVNSDIELIDAPGLRAMLDAQTRDALVIGARVDYVQGQREQGTVYPLGYDFCFFSPDAVAVVPDEPYCLGAPWWDYWLPAVWLDAGRPLRRLVSQVAWHERHPAAYRPSHWMMYGGLMSGRLIDVGRRPSLFPRSINGGKDLIARTERLARALQEQIERRAETLIWP